MAKHANEYESDATSPRIGIGYAIASVMAWNRAAGTGECTWRGLGFELVSGIGYWFSGLVWRTADQIGPLIKIVTVMAKNPPPVRVIRPPKWQS